MTVTFAKSSESSIWILCDQGKIGTLRQCESLAQPFANKMEVHIQSIAIDLPFWFRYLTPRLTRYLPEWLLPMSGFPDRKPVFVIAAGRQALLLAAPLAKKIPTIVLLNPKCPLSYFSVVLPPEHDNVTSVSPHVIQTRGALHPHNAESFRCGEDHKIKNVYTVSVLLGGDSRHHIYTENDFLIMAAYLNEKESSYRSGLTNFSLQVDTSAPKIRFLITSSRRTPAFGLDILATHCANIDLTIWNGEGKNPYFTYLGVADEILVTGDSISMISEACYLGKPVIIWRLPIQNKRFLRFYESLIIHKHAAFHDVSKPDYFTPLRECERVLPQILKILKI